jgi:hypothetical protein
LYIRSIGEAVCRPEDSALPVLHDDRDEDQQKCGNTKDGNDLRGLADTEMRSAVASSRMRSSRTTRRDNPMLIPLST